MPFLIVCHTITGSTRKLAEAALAGAPEFGPADAPHRRKRHTVRSLQKGCNRLGAQLGLVADSPDGSVMEVDLITAKYLGNRTTRIARHLDGTDRSITPDPLRGSA